MRNCLKHTIAIAAGLLVSALAAGCTSRPAETPAPQPDGSKPARSFAAGAPAGESVSPAVDRELQQRLLGEFERLLGNRGGLSAWRQASAGMGVEVDDLTQTNQGGGELLLEWTYRHLGDYDQNGEVNLADIGPIAVHYSAASGGPNWNLAQVADGDRNGEVNLSDLQPIANNYQSSVTGYRVERSSTPGDSQSWALADEVGFAAGVLPAGQPFKRFSTTLSGQTAEFSYRVVAVVAGGGPGPEPGEYDEVEPNDDIASANQLPAGGVSNLRGSAGSGPGYPGYDGDEDDLFRFSAETGQTLTLTLNLDSATGDLDLYLLSGSGESLLDSRGTGGIEQIIANVSSGGTFYAVASAYSGFSDYTLSVSITGGGGNQPPQAAVSANPASGDSPLLVNLDASASTDPDGSIVLYEWDWEDDGVWDFNSGATPTTQCTYTGSNSTFTTRVRVTDDGGLSDTATTQVFVSDPGGFVEPPVQTFTDFSQPGDSAERKWQLNCYSVLPPWQDADRCFQSGVFAGWADEVLALVNQQRGLNGLPALAWDPHLELVAQAHSRDMALRQFFDHSNPYGMDHSARLDAVDRPPYTPGEAINGENIYAGRSNPPTASPAESMEWWMNSPGHRANILNPNVTHIGIGVYYHTDDPSEYYAYFTQVFANWAVDPATHDWLEPAEVPGP